MRNKNRTFNKSILYLMEETLNTISEGEKNGERSVLKKMPETVFGWKEKERKYEKLQEIVDRITPEKTFFRGEVESINIPSVGGACTVMAGHQPMVFAVEPGAIRITADGKTREAFMSEGFVEVRPDETIAFSQAVEWPEDINERRAVDAKERAEEQLRRNRSAAEYRLNRVALARAFARLKVKHHNYMSGD